MKSRRKTALRAALLVLGGLHGIALAASFFGPYNPTHQDRDKPNSPPAELHFRDGDGRFGLFVEDAGPTGDRLLLPIHFFTTQDGGLRLFGVDAPARVNLLGTDSLGRDVLSRLIWGGRVSLLVGAVATFLSLLIGSVIGVVAGYFGGRVDDFLMRTADLFMALPLLYLLLAARALLPLSISSIGAFLLLISVLGLVGWARPARLVRGVALAARERDFVAASRTIGATDLHVLVRHILPQARGVILTQAALLAPQYILAEVTLSFFGIGVSEPTPSWGTILGEGATFSALAAPYWWLLSPGLVLVLTFVAYHSLARSMEGDSRA